MIRTGIVEDKVNTAALDASHVLGQRGEVIPENVLLGGGERVTAGRLELLDVFFSHVDQEGQVGRVAPETD